VQAHLLDVGKVYEEIDEAPAAWLAAQPLGVVATAPLDADGLVNVSPRGHDTFSVLGPRSVGWVDLTGSAVDTIAHLSEKGRICLAGDPLYERVASLHGSHPSTRAVMVVDVGRVSDSCGYGVPVMDLVGERDLLHLSALKRGEEGLQACREEKNAHSLDGLRGL
jgi:hypothetical protein